MTANFVRLLFKKSVEMSDINLTSRNRKRALRKSVLFSMPVPWVPETFLARFPVSVKSFSRLRRSWLRPTAEDVSAFGQTPKTPAAREKNLWYPGYYAGKECSNISETHNYETRKINN